MTIIKIAGDEQHYHTIELQSGRDENWMGEEWIEVPSRLTSALFSSGGYCDLTITDGVLTGIAPVTPPLLAPAQPTADEDRDAMLVDLDYRLTLLDLGVN